MKLKDYIKKHRKTTITAAAEELGITRQHLGELCNNIPSGRKLAIKIALWSDGKVSALEAMRIE